MRYMCQPYFDVYTCSGCGRRALVLHAEAGMLPSPADGRLGAVQVLVALRWYHVPEAIEVCQLSKHSDGQRRFSWPKTWLCEGPSAGNYAIDTPMDETAERVCTRNATARTCQRNCSSLAAVDDEFREGPSQSRGGLRC